MNLLKAFGKIILITLVQIIATLITFQLIQFGPEFILSQEEASQAAPMMFIISIINSLLIYFVLSKVKRDDYKIIFWLSFVWYGIGTVMSQIDTLYYIDAFPLLNPSLVLKIFLMGFINTIIVIPISFFIASKKSNLSIDVDLSKILNENFSKYLLFIATVYVLLYYFAGYFIAWQFDAIRVHYSGSSEKLSFINHTIQLVVREPLFFPFHLARGVLWFGFGIPLFMVLSKSILKNYVYVFFLFALVPSIQLFLPNPLMSEAVRMGHFIEGFVSNGIYGVIAFYVWRKFDSKIGNHL